MKTFLPYECTVGLLYEISDESGMGDCPVCFSMGGRGFKPVLSVEPDEMGGGVSLFLSEEDIDECQEFMPTLNEILQQCEEDGLPEDTLVIGNLSSEGVMVTASAWDTLDEFVAMKATKMIEE